MDKKKILIINLSKGLVGEGNAKLIGSMLITKMYLAAMSRADKTKSELAKLPNYYLYVDEFQSFANKSFADILSEARKYKLGLNITHQYIEQMEEEVRDAVFGNVGTMITFRVGAFDAEVLEKEFAPTFTAEDLVNLGKYQIYLKLMIDEVSSHPFSAVTMNIIPKPEISFKKEVIENSWRQFTRPRGEVEDEIKNWHDEGTVRDEKNRPNYQNNSGEVRKDLNNEIGSRSGRVEFTQNKPGTYREAQYSQKQNFTPPQPVYTSPAPVTPKVSTPDPNKFAFMKAAEDLRSKIDVPKEQVKEVPVSVPVLENRFIRNEVPSSEPIKRQPIIENTTSLSTLKDNKKIPSQENISKLKDALSQVLKKTETVNTEEVKKNSTNPISPISQIGPNSPISPINQTKPISTPTQASVQNPIQENKRTETESPKKEEIKNIESNKEVPEDVLRKVLSMEDNNK